MTPLPRIGLGYDVHPFSDDPDRPFVLGGVTFEGQAGLVGHSDADAAAHAIADALLGAAGLGDLGRLFPADRRTPRGIASTELLREVVRRVVEAGYRPSSVDVVIVGARPRLADLLDGMREVIGTIVGVPEDAVNVKASSGNLVGMEGAGRGMSARAVALVGAVT